MQILFTPTRGYMQNSEIFLNAEHFRKNSDKYLLWHTSFTYRMESEAINWKTP